MNEVPTIARAAKGTASEEDFTLFDMLELVLKHKIRILAVPFAVAALAAALSLLVPNSYRANTKLLPPQQPQSATAALLSQLGGVAGAAAGAAGIKSPNDLYLGMLRSRAIADRLVAQFSLKKVYGTDSQEEARRELEDNTFISSGKDGLITIEVEDEDQARVAKIANTYADELLKLTRVLALTEASHRRMFFERQLEQAKNNLASAEMSLKGALDSRGVISVDGQSRAMVETIGRIRAQISAKESQLASMRAFVTSANPEYRRVEEELKGLRAEQSKLENGRGGSGAEGGDKQVGLENIKILRDVKYYQMLYELLGKQFELARLDEAKESSVIQVLDPAVAPERKFKPKRAIIVLLAFGVTLFAMVSWLFLAETWRRNASRRLR